MEDRAQRILELRERLGISVFEARRMVIHETTLAAIDGAKSMDDIKAILRTIVENWSMKS